MKNLKYFVLPLLLFSFVNQNLLYSAREPGQCGAFAPTVWTDPLLLESGVKYEKLSEHERDCATEGKTGVCYCRVTLGVVTKYNFEGEIKADWFGLTGGWANETTVSAEDIKDLSTNTPGNCVGPMWGYKKRDYKQKCIIRIPKDTVLLYCPPCSSNSIATTLLESPYVTCASSEHGTYEPPLKVGDAICE
jgi:hypothetical protein